MREKNLFEMENLPAELIYFNSILKRVFYFYKEKLPCFWRKRYVLYLKVLKEFECLIACENCTLHLVSKSSY